MGRAAPGGTGPDADDPPRTRTGPVDPAAVDDEVERMRAELASTPVEIVVANHCYGLFELAAVYLSQNPPLLPQASLAIDALACLVEGLGDRLGEAVPQLRDGLSQIQLAYVQITGAVRAGEESAEAAGANGASTGTTGPRSDRPPGRSADDAPGSGSGS